MQSSDPRHFFESDAAQAKREKRATKSSNKYGNPVALKSKLSAVIADPSSSSHVFVAESAGLVRRVNVDDGDGAAVFRGPKAPITCLAIGGPQNKTLFAGSWDKSIWSWDIDKRAPGRKYDGHTDFVKAIVCAKVGGKHILISGGADKRILVWDTDTGARLHSLQDTQQKMLAVQDLAIDPVQTTEDEVLLLSASSDPHIRRWKIRLDNWEQAVETSADIPESKRWTILEHETGVYKLLFDYDGDEVDLWTSSADGTAKCLSRANNFKSEEIFKHGDHVRAVAVTEAWVVTAGRDENLKFWERSTGRPYASLEGHFDEVTGLVVLNSSSREQERVCSVSIDGTVRTWSLLKGTLDDLIKEQEKTAEGDDEDGKDGKPNPVMTAEEDDELAALMEEV